MSLALTGITLATVVYVSAFLFFGTEIFDSSWTAPEDFFDLLGNIGAIIGDIVQFLTLTGLDSSQADPVLLLGLRFFLGLVWFLIIIGFVRGSNQT